ncbi:hypothetical protein C0J52_05791 [Blattella germanica]|nr:hypothetical protein C0J52_05791 [Blattella germanica]
MEVQSFFGFMMLSVILSTVMSLTVEVPAICLEKILFSKVHEPKYMKHREEVEELDKKHLFSNIKIL